MKGQYRIVMEIMLFAIGIAITSFVLVSFQDLQKSTDTISTRNQMDTVLNTVLNGMVKASLTQNSIVRVEIPPAISGRTYRIFVRDGKNLTAMDSKDPTLNASRKIFNIDAPNNRVSGDVTSSARVIEIIYDGNKIIMQRG